MRLAGSPWRMISAHRARPVPSTADAAAAGHPRLAVVYRRQRAVQHEAAGRDRRPARRGLWRRAHRVRHRRGLRVVHGAHGAGQWVPASRLCRPYTPVSFGTPAHRPQRQGGAVIRVRRSGTSAGSQPVLGSPSLGATSEPPHRAAHRPWSQERPLDWHGRGPELTSARSKRPPVVWLAATWGDRALWRRMKRTNHVEVSTSRQTL